MKVDLAEKTEIWIENIVLDNANLTELGNTVAEILELKEKEVLVVDADSSHVTLDVLRNTLDMEQFIGKKDKLLDALDELDGVEITSDTSIHSEGILGTIMLEKEQAEETLVRSEEVAEEVKKRFLNRVKVFPTGNEVIEGVIEDTNSPYIKDKFEDNGYTVSIGRALPDDKNTITNNIENAIFEGFGIIITTGGVGAESKDKTVEATERLDPEAVTPYIVKYDKTGRHAKEGVRIGVGKTGQALIINLPGPNDEVKDCVKIILKELEEGNYNKETIANLLVDRLRKRLVRRSKHA